MTIFRHPHRSTHMQFQVKGHLPTVTTSRKKMLKARDKDDRFLSVIRVLYSHQFMFGRETMTFSPMKNVSRSASVTRVSGLCVDLVKGWDRLSVGDKTRQAVPAGNLRGWHCHHHKSQCSSTAANICAGGLCNYRQSCFPSLGFGRPLIISPYCF